MRHELVPSYKLPECHWPLHDSSRVLSCWCHKDKDHGLCTYFFSYRIPVMEFDSRFQSGNASPIEVLVRSLREEGPAFMFKGWTPAWMRLGPNTVLMFVFFEVSSENLSHGCTSTYSFPTATETWLVLFGPLIIYIQFCCTSSGTQYLMSSSCRIDAWTFTWMPSRHYMIYPRHITLDSYHFHTLFTDKYIIYWGGCLLELTIASLAER